MKTEEKFSLDNSLIIDGCGRVGVGLTNVGFGAGVVVDGTSLASDLHTLRAGGIWVGGKGGEHKSTPMLEADAVAPTPTPPPEAETTASHIDTTEGICNKCPATKTCSSKFWVKNSTTIKI